MSKKLISIILACSLVLSLTFVGVISATAAVDIDGRYVPSESVKETNRIYFLMPESWKNEKFGATEAGAYWWNGSDPCGSVDGTSAGPAWPGYKMQVADADANLYYIDLPSDVPVILFNNHINSGERKINHYTGEVTYEFGEEQFKAAKQTVDTTCQYYSEGDDDYYDNMLDGDFWAKAQEAVEGDDKTFLGNFQKNFFMETEYDLGISMNFDNMVYVIDPNNTSVNEVSGKETYDGEFYFFYGLNEETGNYEYGGLPNYEMANEEGLVWEAYRNAPPVEPTTYDPSKPYNPPTSKGNTINFDVKRSGWYNVKTVYCHIWRTDGTGTWPSWQSKKEKCTYNSSTGIATYDLLKTGNNISKSDGKIYCVIFSANTGMQSYNAIMSGKCIGDTLYCTGRQIENPYDSEKKANEAVWARNKDCGPVKTIASSGNIVGTAFADGENDATMMATYLISYYNDTEKTDKTSDLMNKLNLSPKTVMNEVNKKLDAGYYYNKEKIRSTIKEILSVLKLSKSELTLTLNQTYSLKATLETYLGEAEVGNAKWFSSDRSVATVDSKGKVTAKKVGKATISVQDSDGRVAECKITVLKTLPAPSVSGLTNTAGGIKLSWKKIDGAYGYRVYQKTSNGWKRIKDTTATSYTDSAVSANQTKTYTIRCIDKNGKTISGYNSKGWSKKYTPVAPTISKLDNTSGGIKLSWNKITGVYGYRVYAKTSSGWKKLKDTTATSLTDSAVTANKTKTYTIRCIDKKGKTISGYNSKGWSKKYTAATPKITKLKNTSKGVSVTWNKVAGVYGYRLYRKYAGGSWTKVKDTTSTSFTDSGAKKGKKVTYTVRCIDKKGNTVSNYNKTGWSITRK